LDFFLDRRSGKRQLRAFEEPFALPAGNSFVEFSLLGPEKVEVVFYDVFAEGRARDCTLLEFLGGVSQ
jgi:hypothetical protein